MTQQLERKQRINCERLAKHRYIEQLEVIARHGREVKGVAEREREWERVKRIGRGVL